MPIEYQSKIVDDYLHVVAKGSVCSIDEMLHYIESIFGNMARTGLSKVLADETGCHVHLSLDGLKEAIARVCEPKEFDAAKRKSAILCSIMNHRLYLHTFDPIGCVAIFTNETEARQWLSEE